MLQNGVSQVSDACQINDFDHHAGVDTLVYDVSDACQINDFDHLVVYFWV